MVHWREKMNAMPVYQFETSWKKRAAKRTKCTKCENLFPLESTTPSMSDEVAPKSNSVVLRLLPRFQCWSRRRAFEGKQELEHDELLSTLMHLALLVCTVNSFEIMDVIKSFSCTDAKALRVAATKIIKGLISTSGLVVHEDLDPGNDALDNHRILPQTIKEVVSTFLSSTSAVTELSTPQHILKPSTSSLTEISLTSCQAFSSEKRHYSLNESVTPCNSEHCLTAMQLCRGEDTGSPSTRTVQGSRQLCEKYREVSKVFETFEEQVPPSSLFSYVRQEFCRIQERRAAPKRQDTGITETTIATATMLENALKSTVISGSTSSPGASNAAFKKSCELEAHADMELEAHADINQQEGNQAVANGTLKNPETSEMKVPAEVLDLGPGMLEWYAKRRKKKEMRELSQKVTYGNVIRARSDQPPFTPVVRWTAPIQTAGTGSGQDENVAVQIGHSESLCSMKECTFDLPGVISGRDEVYMAPAPRQRSRLCTWPENRATHNIIV